MYDLIATIPVAVESIGVLRGIAAANGASVEAIGARKEHNVVQVLHNGQATEVWTRPGDGQSRGYGSYVHAWEAVFGQSIGAYLPKWNKLTEQSRSDKVQLDHLLADRVAGLLGYSHVRLFPVLGEINMHQGRSFEGAIKSQTSAGGAANRINYRNGAEYMDVLSLSKVLNFKLLHARYKGGAPSDRNLEFLAYMDNPQRTTQLLRDLGLIWW